MNYCMDEPTDAVSGMFSYNCFHTESKSCAAAFFCVDVAYTLFPYPLWDAQFFYEKHTVKSLI